MAPDPDRIKIMEQSLARAERDLRTTADKDQQRRHIAAIKARLRKEREA